MALVPDVVLGGIMATHGVGALVALWHLDVPMCRRSALASVALWCFVLTLLFLAPPSDLIVIPLVAGLALASGWVHVRLTIWVGARSRKRAT
jgi:hydrogenase/urease accessory protein HupE